LREILRNASSSTDLDLSSVGPYPRGMSWTKRAGVATFGLLVFASFEGCATSGDVSAVEGTGEGDAEGGTVTEGGTSNPVDAATDTVTSSDAPSEGSATGNPVGFPCSKAQDCVTGLCKPVLPGGGSSLCVAPCTTQANCADNFFCDPVTPGASTGFCVPRSPAHCKTCSASAECGSLSEVCATAAGDTVKACHVDCTIGGSAACPPDYSCLNTMLDGTASLVCRPNGGLSCLDSLGGYCDRVATPQACARTNVAGKCVGQRACLAASTRLDTCAAIAPVCRTTCASTDPAGCTTSYCAEATAGPANCGACGNVCPGNGTANATVTCAQPNCSFSCQGETYNVDNNKANGCEISDPTAGNHTTNTATVVGDRACYDDSSNPNISGRMPSDSETHAPAIASFDAVTGSASDYHVIRAVGQSSVINPCVNNVVLELVMTGSAYPACYHLRVQTNKYTFDCDTSAAGTCKINETSSSRYDDDTDIMVTVSKRNVAGCLAASRDNPSYTVKGNL
jgi:hypothetical protein